LEKWYLYYTKNPERVKNDPPATKKFVAIVNYVSVTTLLNNHVPIAYIKPPNPACKSTLNPAKSAVILFHLIFLLVLSRSSVVAVLKHFHV
jgi:hypothetical protein